MEETEVKTKIWKRYEQAKDQHLRMNMHQAVKRAHNFYEGNQWEGAKTGGETLPVLNFIKPICKYQIGTVAMNDTAIIYNSMTDDDTLRGVCDALTRFAAAQWEKGKMDSKKWEIIKNACITGDHYLYCYDERSPTESVAVDLNPRLAMQLVDKDEIYFADEQQKDREKQEWIIIRERVPVASVRREARKNGLPEEEIEMIVSDEDLASGDDTTEEVKTDEGKCISLLYMEKTEAGVSFCRSVRSVVYQPMQTLPGMKHYPVAGMVWDVKHKSARGVGVAERLIPNQIEVNKTLARRSISVKRYGYPTAVVDSQKVQNPESLQKVGSTVKVRNLGGNPISSMVGYISPAPMSNDAAALEAEILTQSRELEGAGDAATGQVDPTKTSGEAIKAARDQSALPLNEQMSAYKQFVENLALIWMDLWKVYSTEGMSIEFKDDQQNPVSAFIPAQIMEALEVSVRIDVSPVDPYSVLSRELSLENALAAGHITFEEYVSVLDDNSGVPKEKLQQILDQRKAAQEAMQAQQMQQLMAMGANAGTAQMGGATMDTTAAMPDTQAQMGGVPVGMV